MAAGVNFNNVWAALGNPVSVFGYGDHPEYGHHIGGSDASGVVWKVGPGVTRWKAGDEVVIHCNLTSYEDPEVHGLDPMAAPSQRIWGYETTWGSFAQFTKVQAQQLLPKPANLDWDEASSYGLTYFTAYRMLFNRAQLQAGQKVLIWGAAGGLGVFATQLVAAAGGQSVGVVSTDEKGELVKQLGAADYINRNEFAGMMRTGDEDADEEKARFKVSRAFAKRVQEILGEAARRRLRARRQGDVPDLGASRSRRSARSSSAAPRRATRSTSTSATCGCARRRSSARTSPTRGSATWPTSSSRRARSARCCGRRCPSRTSPRPTS